MFPVFKFSVTVKFPPTYTLLATPMPPSVTIDPVSISVASFVFSTKSLPVFTVFPSSGIILMFPKTDNLSLMSNSLDPIPTSPVLFILTTVVGAMLLTFFILMSSVEPDTEFCITVELLSTLMLV